MKEASLLNFSTYYKGTVIKTMWFMEPLGKLSLVLWAVLAPVSVWWCFPLSPQALWHVHLPLSVLGERESSGQGRQMNHSSVTSSCTRSGL